jgi:hypothetical protein
MRANYLRNIPYEKVETISVPRYRIPLWHDKIEKNYGGLFRDDSGYEHHGWLGTHYGNRHTADGPYGFRFSHNYGKAKFPVQAANGLNRHAPAFERADNGEGFLRFDGEPLPCSPRGEFQAYTHLLLGMEPVPGRAKHLGNPRSRQHPFSGDLSEVRISGRPLTPAEFIR